MKIRKLAVLLFVQALCVVALTIPSIAATISGTLYKSDGTTPITDAQIVVNAFSGSCGSGQFIASGSSNTGDGTYSITGLPPGTYFLGTWNMNQSDYVNEWWVSTGSQFNCNSAEPVEISNSGETISGKYFQLDFGGSISGTVFQSDGTTPLTGVNIQIEAVSGTPCGQRWSMGWASTNPADGTYAMRGVPLGTYSLWSNNTGQSAYVNEWWRSPLSTYNCGEAQTVNLSTPGQAITGRNFQVELGGSISGSVFGEYGPIEGVNIQVFSGVCGQNWLSGVMTDEDGHYTVNALPAVNVYVKACATCSSHLNYIDKHYDTGDGVTDNECGTATPVSVTSGSDTPFIDFYLDRGTKRTSGIEVVVSNGNLSPYVGVQPAFRDLVGSITLTMPNPARGTGGTDTFDLTNDILLWTSECRYTIGWTKNLGAVESADYGMYTFTVAFEDGVQEVYTWEVKNVTVIRPQDIAVNVGDNGSVLVTWNRATSSDYHYQVRVRDGAQEIFRSNTFKNINQLNISAYDLRCLEIGKTYQWLVRAYDNSLYGGMYSWAETASISAAYSPLSLTNRFTGASAQNWKGHLALSFNTRPGSREYVKSITVSGPEGVIVGAGGPFSYAFKLDEDWIDISTETRWNNSWWKEDATWVPVNGTYTFTIEYDDNLDGSTDYTEVVNKTLSSDSVSAVDASTMGAALFPDGAIYFYWGFTDNPAVKYEVRIRSQDGSDEYYSSGWLDANNVYANFNATRAMVRGQTYQWFVRVYSPDGDTMVQSSTKQFLYDPAPVYDATSATFGPDSAALTNPYFPFRLGDRLNYVGTGSLSGYSRYFEAVDTDFVDSVNCLKVLVRGNGNHVTPEFDPEWYYAWFAQDKAGNVWMLQLFSAEEPITVFAGLSEAVLWMPANLVAGKIYSQVGDEYAQVHKTGVNVPQLSTGLGPYSSCLMVLKGEGPFDFDTEYIAPSVGIVREEWENSGQERGWELAEEIRQGAYDELVVSFGSTGLYHYVDGAFLPRLSTAVPENMLAVNRELFLDLGTRGVWRYSDGIWDKLSPYNAEGMLAVGSEVWIDLGPMGLWLYSDNEMIRKRRANPESMVAAGGDLYVDFGSLGLYRYDGVWALVNLGDAEGMIALGSDLYVDFGPAGFWKYSRGVWKRLSTLNAESMLVVGTNLYVDFGSSGLYKYDGTKFARIMLADARAMIGVGGVLYVDYGGVSTGGLGLYKYDGAWARISPYDAESMCAAGSVLYVDFGSEGLHKYEGTGTTMTRIIAWNAQSVTGVGISLYADFGGTATGGRGLYKYDGAWSRINTNDADGMCPVNLQ